MSQDNYKQGYSDHYWKTEIPNTVLRDYKLTPVQFTVYTQIKSITGDGGDCWMSKENLAELVGISRTTLIKTIKELIKFKLLTESKRKRKSGGHDTSIINVRDIWSENGKAFKTYKEKSRYSKSEQRDVQNLDARCTKSVQKEEPIEEEPIKKNKYIHTTTTKRASIEKPKQEEGGGGIKKINYSGDLFYRDTKGSSQKVTSTEIFKYFLSKPFSTQIVEMAISEARKSNEFIGNIYRYLEAICVRLANKSEEPKTETAKIKSKKNLETVEELEIRPPPVKKDIKKILETNKKYWTF